MSYESVLPFIGKVRFAIDTITDDDGDSYDVIMINASDVARNHGATNGEQALKAVSYEYEYDAQRYSETYIDVDTLEKFISMLNK